MNVSDAMLSVVMLLVTWSFYRAQRDPNISFNLFDLIMENGKVSKLAFAFMVGLTCLTWIMIKLTLSHDMTEGYVGLYGGIIIAPVIAKLFSPPPPPSTVTTTTKTEVT
jgi:hypothetical protein